MLDEIKQLIARVRPPAARPSGEPREPALRLAAAALLFEVSRIDGTITAEERTVMRAAVQSALGLPADETERLLQMAEGRSRAAVSVYELTQVLDRELPLDEKKRVVELLWLVAFADGRKDPLEEHVVRQVAGLLHVPHPDFIDAKIRAREQGGPQRAR
jgi:uncharacterized tellurite resistance protein B-like protein